MSLQITVWVAPDDIGALFYRSGKLVSRETDQALDEFPGHWKPQQGECGFSRTSKGISLLFTSREDEALAGQNQTYDFRPD